MEQSTPQQEKRTYESRKRPRFRGEEYYPSQDLKDQLNAYSMQTGVYKSELAVKLLKAFFSARKKEGKDPEVIRVSY